MPVNSVSLFLKSQLDGIRPPGETGLPGPLSAQINPYDPDESGDARVYIWPVTGVESRRTIPRGPVTANGAPPPADATGSKLQQHAMSIWLVWFGYDSDPDADSSFPLLIDHVMAVLRWSCPVQVVLTDPDTGFQSQLLGVGEHMTWEYVPVMSTDDQRVLRYDCRIEVRYRELFIG